MASRRQRILPATTALAPAAAATGGGAPIGSDLLITFGERAPRGADGLNRAPPRAQTA